MPPSDKKSDVQPLLREDSTNPRQRIDVMGVNVINDDWMGDIVFITPIKMAEEHLKAQDRTQPDGDELPKVDGKKYNWDQVYKAADCIKMAKEIFMAHRPKLNEDKLPTSNTRLEADFGKNMTRLEFHQKVIERAIDVISGERIALTVRTMESADKDEMFICLSTDTSSEVVKLVANSEGYRARVKAEAYPWNAREGKPSQVPQIEGEPAYMWTTYDYDEDEKFENFRDIDKLRMMRRRIAHFVSSNALLKYGVICSSFVVHKWDKVQALASAEGNFGNIANFWKFPARDMTKVNQYFGEELTFFFHWYRYYAIQLILPAIISVALFSRRFFLDSHQQRICCDLFALFMALWAAAFCENYNRATIIQSCLWGVRNYDNVATVRPGYRDCADTDRKATRFAAAGASLMATFLFLVISGIAIIQSVRYVMVHHPSDNPITATIMDVMDSRSEAQKYGAKLGAFAITFQVKVLDFIWGKIAVYVTDNENHKTEQRYQSSLVFKIVAVKFFNAMYPFMYVAFAKEFVEGCKSPDGSCIFALETCIIMFFVVHVGMACAMTFKRIIMTRIKIRSEMKRPGIDANNYTYLQVQAKCDPFRSSDMLPDFMELSVQFAMVVCFSVVLPILVLIALGCNLLLFRLFATRQLFIVQRVHPTGAEGIGAWHSIFASIATLAVLVNAGLAVFGMQPFRSYDLSARILAFLIVEHVLVFTKSAIEIVIPDLPLEVDKAEDKNEEFEQKIFGGGFKPVAVPVSDLPMQTGVWLSCDMGETVKHKQRPLYKPFHLTDSTGTQKKAVAGVKKAVAGLNTLNTGLNTLNTYLNK